MGCHTISRRHLYKEDRAINLIRAASGEARKTRHGWDMKPQADWNAEDVEYLITRVRNIVQQNPWISVEQVHEGIHKIFAASDASGETGWGVVEWTYGLCRELAKGQWNNTPMRDAHIYLKEFYALTRAVEHLCKTHKSAIIYVQVDNTAVVGSVRCMYSSNSVGNEFVRRIDLALTAANNRLEIVSVRSEDNAADAASRNKCMDVAVAESGMNIFRLYLLGGGRNSVRHKEPRNHTGELLHPEPDDIAGGLVKLDLCLNLLEDDLLGL